MHPLLSITCVRGDVDVIMTSSSNCGMYVIVYRMGVNRLKIACHVCVRARRLTPNQLPFSKEGISRWDVVDLGCSHSIDD